MSRIPHSAFRNLILQAKYAYYYSNAPIISDAEYDAQEDELPRVLTASGPRWLDRKRLINRTIPSAGDLV